MLIKIKKFLKYDDIGGKFSKKIYDYYSKYWNIKSGNLITFLRNLYKIYIHMRRTSVYSHKFDEQKVNCNRNSIENKVELYVIQIWKLNRIVNSKFNMISWIIAPSWNMKIFFVFLCQKRRFQKRKIDC